MTPLIENVWDLLNNEYNAHYKKNPNFKFNVNKKESFKNKFTQEYEKIINKYMDPSVATLDRHKVAALIIISILEADAISYDNLDNDCIFIGSELLALKVGLAYMIDKLNEKLSARGINKKIETFQFPNAQSCPTPYIEVICRNLHYAKTDYIFNPLDLADRLFLIEYIALTKEKIDPDQLKDY